MGLFDKVKKIFGSENKFTSIDEFDQILNYFIDDLTSIKNYSYLYNFSKTVQGVEVKAWDLAKRLAFLEHVVQVYNSTFATDNNKQQQRNSVCMQLLRYLVNEAIPISNDTIRIISENLIKLKKHQWYADNYIPLFKLVSLIEKNIPELSAETIEVLKKIKKDSNHETFYYYKKQVAKLHDLIDGMIFKATNHTDEVAPVLFYDADEFAEFANTQIANLSISEKNLWYSALSLSKKSTGSKPSNKILIEGKQIVDKIGQAHFYEMVDSWFDFLIKLKETVKNNIHDNGYEYQTITYLDNLNSEMVKGIVWMYSTYLNKERCYKLSKLADRSYKKIAGKGPTAAAVGNACLYALGSKSNLDGVAFLTKLRLKVKNNSILNIIERIINEAALNAGLNNFEVEELAVDDLEIIDDKKSFSYGIYTAELEITGIGKSNIVWKNEKGVAQKAIPSAIKTEMAAEIKELKQAQKILDESLVVQKDRLDRMMRYDRKMTLTYFNNNYINNSTLAYVIRNLIFVLSSSSSNKRAIFRNQQWFDYNNEVINIAHFESVALWHPATSSTDEVKQWRQYLLKHSLQQPFKQAYREIYILTDAEIRTDTYSNRMAAHILKQHQYVTLAKGRNWNSRLLGSWDGGDLDTATLKLPEYNLQAEFWVNALDSDNEYNNSGIWNYVTTDQIRFVRLDSKELVPLIDVHPIVFSEVFRDVDLFVGVASVGNDPTWADSGGLPAYRSYWQQYSFGDLSEVAKNRREILTTLLPRLKIASVATLEDRFLRIQGSLRTYKIHLGSTNILMEPNDQYLCIVPDRTKSSQTEKIFLPFEGDTGLSIILSKAFLLADDKNIKDSTITSQINR